MASGYLDLAYLIEISVVFNLAYREIKHGTVLARMKQIRDKMSKDTELQERIEGMQKEVDVSSKKVKNDYEKLIAMIECDATKSKDCQNTDSNLCEAWNHNQKYCKHFFNTILTGKGLIRVNVSIGIALIILLFATIFPHIPIDFYIILWWALCIALVVTIFIPIRLLYMSEKIGNMLIGKNGHKGLIEKLEAEFTANYNQHLTDQSANKDFI